MLKNKPKNQNTWTNAKLVCASRLFMDGQSYDQIAEVLVGFTSKSIESKLNTHGFTKEYRKNQLVRAVNQ